MLATEIFGNPSTRTLGRGEETQLSLGGTLTGSELFSPNLNLPVRTERLFEIHYLSDIKDVTDYLNVVIIPLCGNLDIRRILYGCFQSQIATGSETCFLDRAEHVSAPNMYTSKAESSATTL